jgi:hypothetical protein
LSSRTHKQQIVKLRKLLTESSKSRRHRRNLINIHITILNWLVEFIAFFFVLLGSVILGHDNSIVTYFMHSLTILFYFNILPCTFLVNKSDLKGLMAESRWYISFLNLFGCADYQPEQIGNNEEDQENRP